MIDSCHSPPHPAPHHSVCSPPHGGGRDQYGCGGGHWVYWGDPSVLETPNILPPPVYRPPPQYSGTSPHISPPPAPGFAPLPPISGRPPRPLRTLRHRSDIPACPPPAPPPWCEAPPPRARLHPPRARPRSPAPSLHGSGGGGGGLLILPLPPPNLAPRRPRASHARVPSCVARPPSRASPHPPRLPPPRPCEARWGDGRASVQDNPPPARSRLPVQGPSSCKARPVQRRVTLRPPPPAPGLCKAQPCNIPPPCKAHLHATPSRARPRVPHPPAPSRRARLVRRPPWCEACSRASAVVVRRPRARPLCETCPRARPVLVRGLLAQGPCARLILVQGSSSCKARPRARPILVQDPCARLILV
ncbi:uncharacterized protein [Struthio camelus]|uniref:uncharacterized protein n=1 Tax=Struthio camelus TaxID=8801 RepID=UPI003603B738